MIFNPIPHIKHTLNGSQYGGLSDVMGRDFLGDQQIRKLGTHTVRRATDLSMFLYIWIPQKSHGIFDVCPFNHSYFPSEPQGTIAKHQMTIS
jgi:hypothetical protein